MIGEAHITLCDHLNPGFGYQVRVVDDRGETLLFTTRDPVTGVDLLTFDHALRVMDAYAKGPRHDPKGVCSGYYRTGLHRCAICGEVATEDFVESEEART